eukprot:gene10088-3329_t
MANGHVTDAKGVCQCDAEGLVKNQMLNFNENDNWQQCTRPNADHADRCRALSSLGSLLPGDDDGGSLETCPGWERRGNGPNKDGCIFRKRNTFKTCTTFCGEIGAADGSPDAGLWTCVLAAANDDDFKCILENDFAVFDCRLRTAEVCICKPPNECSCNNGFAAVGSACVVNATQQCDSCLDGYELNDATQACYRIPTTITQTTTTAPKTTTKAATAANSSIPAPATTKTTTTRTTVTATSTTVTTDTTTKYTPGLCFGVLESATCGTVISQEDCVVNNLARKICSVMCDVCTSTTTSTSTTTTTSGPINIDCIEIEDACTAVCEKAADRNYQIGQTTVGEGASCVGPTNCMPGDGSCGSTGLPGYAYGAIAVGSIIVLVGLGVFVYRQGRNQSACRTSGSGGDDNTRIPTVEELTTFGHHVALAMTFLEYHRMLHRDLATRNVLLTDQRMCKLADFGLSRTGRDAAERYEELKLYITEGNGGVKFYQAPGPTPP